MCRHFSCTSMKIQLYALPYWLCMYVCEVYISMIESACCKEFDTNFCLSLRLMTIELAAFPGHQKLFPLSVKISSSRHFSFSNYRFYIFALCKFVLLCSLAQFKVICTRPDKLATVTCPPVFVFVPVTLSLSMSLIKMFAPN